MTCSAALGVYAESGMSIGSVIVKLGEYGQADRAVILRMLRTLLGIDSGIDVVKSSVRNYNGNSSDKTDQVIGRLLNSYSKEELISFLDVLKEIDEDTRYDFFTDIIKLRGVAVTDEQGDAVNDVCYFYLGSAYPDFQRICEEDGVDTGVIAKMLSVGKKINGGKAIYIDGPGNSLAYNELSDTYRAFASQNQSVDLDESLAKINSNPNLVKAIKISGPVTDLYEGIGYIEDTASSGDSGDTYESGGNTGGISDLGEGDKPPVTHKADDTDTENDETTQTPEDIENNTENPKTEAFFDLADHWSRDYVNAMAEKGIFKGYGDGTFLPDKALTRQEMAVTVVRVLGIEEELTGVSAESFTDNDKIAAWAKDYVYILSSRGIFAGYADGSFGPDDLITREQFALVIARISSTQLPESFALSFADNAKISAWAADAVREMLYSEIVTGYEDNTFRPNKSLTRAEACTMIYRYINK